MPFFPMLTDLWSKIAFQLVHKTTIWLLLAFFMTSFSLWHLSTLLDNHNARESEAKLARTSAAAYSLFALALWIFSLIMS